MEIHDRCRGPRATRGAKVSALRAKGLLSWGVGNMPVVVHGGSELAGHLEFCLALRVQHVLHPLHQVHALIVESALAGVDGGARSANDAKVGRHTRLGLLSGRHRTLEVGRATVRSRCSSATDASVQLPSTG